MYFHFQSDRRGLVCLHIIGCCNFRFIVNEENVAHLYSDYFSVVDLYSISMYLNETFSVSILG